MDETDSYASLGVGVGTVSLLFSVYFIILYIMSYPKKKMQCREMQFFDRSCSDHYFIPSIFFFFFFGFLLSRHLFHNSTCCQKMFIL